MERPEGLVRVEDAAIGLTSPPIVALSPAYSIVIDARDVMLWLKSPPGMRYRRPERCIAIEFSIALRQRWFTYGQRT